MRIMLVSLLLSLLAGTAWSADSLLVWSGEVRVRGEVDGRDFKSRTPANGYTFLRTRLGADVRPAPGVRAFVQLQDSRVFGDEGAVNPANTRRNTRNLDLHQGYLVVEDLFAPGLSLKLGRMELSYGGERIVGRDDWANAGRAFDAGCVRYAWCGNFVDLFTANVAETTIPPATITQGTVAGEGDHGLLFSGLYCSTRILADLDLDGYLLHEWNQHQTVPSEYDLTRYTVGTYVRYASYGWHHEAEVAYQGGKREGRKVNAFLAAGASGYSIEGGPISAVTVGYTYASGGALAEAGYRSFDPVYHSGRSFHGCMGYFENIPENTFDRGLQDLMLHLELKPAETFSLSLRVHNFLTAQLWSGKRDIGQEIDLTGGLCWGSNLNFEIGACGFVPGEVMRAWFGGTDVAWWGYATTRIWF